MTQNELQLNKKLRDSFKKDKETGEALGWIGGCNNYGAMELWIILQHNCRKNLYMLAH